MADINISKSTLVATISTKEYVATIKSNNNIIVSQGLNDSRINGSMFESNTLFHNLIISLNEIIILYDELLYTQAIPSPTTILNEATNISDMLVNYLEIIKLDELNITETVKLNIEVLFNDTISIIDNLTNILSTKIVNEATNVSDRLVNNLGINKLDELTIIETVKLNIEVLFNDTITIIDEFTYLQFIPSPTTILNEATNISDMLVNYLEIIKLDELNITETVKLNIEVLFNEVTNISDTLVNHLVMTKLELFNTIDTVGLVTDKLINDSINISENKSAVIVKNLLEVNTIIDSGEVFLDNYINNYYSEPYIGTTTTF